MYPYVSVGSHGSQQSPFGTTSSRYGSSRKTRSFLHFPRLFISHQDLYLAPPLNPLSLSLKLSILLALGNIIICQDLIIYDVWSATYHHKNA